MRIIKKENGSVHSGPHMTGGWVILLLLLLSLTVCRAEATEMGQEQNGNPEESREETGLIGDFVSELDKCLTELPYSGIIDDGYFLKSIVKEIAKANIENANEKSEEENGAASDNENAKEPESSDMEESVSGNTEGVDANAADSSKNAAADWQELLGEEKEIIVAELEQQLSEWRYEYQCSFGNENNQVWWRGEESPYEVIYEALCEVYGVETESASLDESNLETQQDVGEEEQVSESPLIEAALSDRTDQVEPNPEKEENKETGLFLIVLIVAALALLAISIFMILLVEKIRRSLQKLDEAAKANTESFLEHVEMIEDILCAPSFDSSTLSLEKEMDEEASVQDVQIQLKEPVEESYPSETASIGPEMGSDIRKEEPVRETPYEEEMAEYAAAGDGQNERKELFPVQIAENKFAFSTNPAGGKVLNRYIHFYLVKEKEENQLQIEIKQERLSIKNLSDYKVITELYILKDNQGTIEWDPKSNDRVIITNQKGVPLEWDGCYGNYKPKGKGVLYIKLKRALQFNGSIK